MFDNNFGKRRPIFQIISLGDSKKKFSMYTSQRFPPYLQYVATLPCVSRKSKNVTALLPLTAQHPQHTVDVLIRTL